jgi:hypothetical protein
LKGHGEQKEAPLHYVPDNPATETQIDPEQGTPTEQQASVAQYG